jgi:parallel beta-helix repeat protein
LCFSLWQPGATGWNNTMARVLLALFICLFSVNPAVAKRVALVVGNSTYAHVNPLTNPANDSALIETVLTEAGFDVVRLNNLDQKAMKQAMLDFGRKLKQGAEASLFYYAGHGIEVDGRNYLIPVDSNTASKEEADIQNIDVNDILALMENSGVPLNILVLDACRNNPFRGLRATGGGLAPVRAPAGSFIAYATAPGQVAADGEGSNSPFTLALAENLRIAGLPLETVFKQTRAKVRAATNGEQVPFDSSAIEGDFYFLPPKAPENQTDDQKAIDSKAESALAAAGSNREMLRVVATEFSGSVWGKLAEARLRDLEAELALLAPAPKPAGDGKATLRVAADGSGNYRSVVEALLAAKPDSRIEVMPGTYKSALVVDKAVEIVGIGLASDIRIEASGNHTIVWQATGGGLLNLSIAQTGGCANKCGAVIVRNGAPVIADSILSSANGSTIAIVGSDSKPLVLRNRIVNGAQQGIYLDQQATGLIDGNEISGSGFAAIEIRGGANPTVSKNRIYGGKLGGIYITAGGLGVVEENEIYENAEVAIEVSGRANPVVRLNLLRNGLAGGLFIHEGATGLFESNRITGNALSGIEVASGANPSIRLNVMTDSKQGGVLVQGRETAGLFENNTISGNALAGIEVKDEANPTVRSNKISGNGGSGVFVWNKGAGSYIENTLGGNKKGAFDIRKNAGKLLREGNVPPK